MHNPTLAGVGRPPPAAVCCEHDGVARVGVSSPGADAGDTAGPASGPGAGVAAGEGSAGGGGEATAVEAGRGGADRAGQSGVGERAGRSLIRSTRTMAVATVASRLTGFLRTAVMAAVLGAGSFNEAFVIANTLPNNLYEFLLGGILTSTLVPLLVQARERDSDGGLAYAQRLFTLIAGTLLAVSVLAVFAGPWLVGLYSNTPDAAELALAGRWARFFLPQIVFYGMSALFGALLNTRSRFGAPMWAPVLNNLVVIATFGVFLLVPGPARPGPGSLSRAQFAVLGVGTTAGVVAMTVALLPSLRAVGLRLRVRLDLRGLGLGHIGRLAAWTLLYVAATQLSYLVLTRLASRYQQQPTYTFAFTVWQLPHAVVAVSVITALLPAMSRHAVHGRLAEIRADVDRGIRLSALILIPSAVAFIVLGRDIAVLLFAHGRTDVAAADRIGWTLAVFAVGLVPFSVYQLQSRAFYAMRDTRTPALIQVAVSAVLVIVDVAFSALVRGEQRVYVLAAGHAIAYLTGVVISVAVLRRRLGRAAPTGSRGVGMRSYLARLAGAAMLGAGVAGLVASGMGALLAPGAGGAAIVLAVALPVGAAAYLLGLAVLRVSEVAALAHLVRTRLHR